MISRGLPGAGRLLLERQLRRRDFLLLGSGEYAVLSKGDPRLVGDDQLLDGCGAQPGVIIETLDRIWYPRGQLLVFSSRVDQLVHKCFVWTISRCLLPRG